MLFKNQWLLEKMPGMTFINDPLFCFAAVSAVLLAGISKGGFGSAFGGIGVPLMALAVSPLEAAAILLPIHCLMDLAGLRIYFGKWDLPNLKLMLPGGLLGIAIGTLTAGLFNEASIQLLVGAIAIMFTLNHWFGFASRQGPSGPSAVKGTLWSIVSGFTSFVAHAGGPPAQMYLLPQRLDKVAYVATLNLFFMTHNAVKVVPYFWLGQLSTTTLSTSLLLAPLAPIGVWAGLWLHRRVNHTWFYRIGQTCLLLTGLHLVYRGLAV
jgi:uncharacterized membrane protein YfcA